jgi:hypothetical protein
LFFLLIGNLCWLRLFGPRVHEASRHMERQTGRASEAILWMPEQGVIAADPARHGALIERGASPAPVLTGALHVPRQRSLSAD